MKLQEWALKSVVTQIRYPVSPLYPDVRGGLIRELLSATEFEHWAWGDDGLRVWPEDNSATIVCASRETRVAFHRLEDVGGFEKLAHTAFDLALRVLAVESVEFVGVRSYWAAAADSFAAIRDWLMDTALADVKAVYGPLGQTLTDVGVVLEFHDGDPKVTVRFGPGRKDQVATMVAQEATDHYPEDFMFLDFDRVFNERKTDVGDVSDLWSESLQKNLDAAERFGVALTRSFGSSESPVR